MVRFRKVLFALMFSVLCILLVVIIAARTDEYDRPPEKNVDIKVSTDVPSTNVQLSRNYPIGNIKESRVFSFPIESEVEVIDEVVKEVEYVTYYTEDDVINGSKILYREARGIDSDTELANVIWVILNRYDSGEYGDTIYDVMTSPNQFAYSNKDYSYEPEWDRLYRVTSDVFKRWNDEQNGIDSVGRTLPSDYIWFTGDGVHNTFRNVFQCGTSSDLIICDWLESPYDS